jgi:hypothetical protein
MNGLKHQAAADLFAKPIFDRIIEESECLAPCAIIHSIDMSSALVSSLETISLVLLLGLGLIELLIRGVFEFVLEHACTCHAFGGWFDCEFTSGMAETPNKIILSTSPKDTPTHWRQVTFVLSSPIELEAGARIKGEMSIRRQTFWRRHFEVEMRFTTDDRNESIQIFPLWR